MVTEIVCDILKAPVDIIFHQANCQHTMGSGVAKLLRDNYPEVYDADCNQTKRGDKAKLGTVSIATINRPDTRLKYVFNLYGQFNFGRDKRYTNYEAIYRALEEAKGKITNTQLVIGIPYKMSCNLAGGNWRIVKTMIEEVFNGPLQVLICKHPDIKD